MTFIEASALKDRNIQKIGEIRKKVAARERVKARQPDPDMIEILVSGATRPALWKEDVGASLGPDEYDAYFARGPVLEGPTGQVKELARADSALVVYMVQHAEAIAAELRASRAKEVLTGDEITAKVKALVGIFERSLTDQAALKLLPEHLRGKLERLGYQAREEPGSVMAILFKHLAAFAAGGQP